VKDKVFRVCASLSVVALLAGSQAVISRPPFQSPMMAGLSPTTSTTFRTTTTPVPTTATTGPTTTTLNPGEPVGLLTTTGVPVRVLATDGDLWLVSSPCGWDVWLSGGTPIYQTTVILDPGHGGSSDTGATGPNGLQEKVVNLRIAREAQRLLDERGISNVLTRTGDYASTLRARAALADALQATLMVSIHHNAPTPPPSPVPGNEVYVQSNSTQSRRLGELLFEYSMEALGQFDIQWSSTPNRGVMTVRHPEGHDVYGILRHPSTPTALLEFGRLSHAPEAALFATNGYVRAAAGAVVEAVEAFLQTEEQGSGWIDGLVRRANRSLSQTNCVDPDLGG